MERGKGDIKEARFSFMKGMQTPYAEGKTVFLLYSLRVFFLRYPCIWWGSIATIGQSHGVGKKEMRQSC